VVRLKIDPNNNNGSLRDPSIYRCVVDTLHNRTGDKYKVYPLYDFACPIVDSVEGVTHALRSKEYHEHNPLYEFVLKVLKLRFVQIEDFSRLNFQFTLLSKRKLQWFVDEGHVSGWDSPAFPTIRGMLRRGLSVAALKMFMTEQGSSKSDVNMEIKHLWSRNRVIIDPIAPRHLAVEDEFKVKLTLTNGPTTAAARVISKHPKNKELGEHALMLSSQLWLEGEDTKLMSEGEEITLMGWGNCVVKKIERDGDRVLSLTGEFNPNGDFKATKLKVAWVPAVDDVVPIEMQEFDILITKSKLEKDDKFEDFVNSKIVYKVFFFGGEGVFFRLFVCVLCLLNGLWHANSPNTWVPPLCVAFRKGTLFSCSVAATSRWTACSRTISPLSSCTCPMDTTSTCSAQPSRVPRVSNLGRVRYLRSLSPLTVVIHWTVVHLFVVHIPVVWWFRGVLIKYGSWALY
jgi:tRNA synthetases class I (E and Q), catalytic domain/tRNA synthetases class I (E and Q), anti-codon binding domain